MNIPTNSDFRPLTDADRREIAHEHWLTTQSPATPVETIAGVPVEPIAHLSTYACPIQGGALGGGSFTDAGELDIPF